MCNTGPRPLALTEAELYFQMTKNELNDPKGPENIICTMMMYREAFYGRHMAQYQLQ